MNNPSIESQREINEIQVDSLAKTFGYGIKNPEHFALEMKKLQEGINEAAGKSKEQK